MTDTKQIDKFKETARELECNENEAAFDAKLKKVAKPEAREQSDD